MFMSLFPVTLSSAKNVSTFPVHKYECVSGAYISACFHCINISVFSVHTSVFPVHIYQLVSSAQINPDRIYKVSVCKMDYFVA